MAASWSGPQEGQPNTRSRRDVSSPRQAPLGRFPSTLSAENRRPTGYQQLLTQHGVGDRRCEIRLTQESPIQAVTFGFRRSRSGQLPNQTSSLAAVSLCSQEEAQESTSP